jgi:UDPglucose--hexose-1-phosphate uridylyltransferase
VRVVPNKFPAVSHLDNVSEQNQSRRHFHHRAESMLLNNEVPAVGFHEVVIESPHHNKHLATSLDMTKNLLIAFRQRGRAHREFAEVEHTVYFKNHGSTAGASLVHPHSQIVSTPVVPVEAQRLQSFALDYFKQHRFNLYERVVDEELFLYQSTNSKSRVVDFTDNFLAVVPYASTGPYVLLILPRFYGSGTDIDNLVDCSDFTTTTDDLLDECAAILHSCLKRLNLLLDEPNFNLVVQTAPISGRGVQAGFQASAYFRWHIRITPRLGAGAMAGFELGTTAEKRAFLKFFLF